MSIYEKELSMAHAMIWVGSRQTGFRYLAFRVGGEAMKDREPTVVRAGQRKTTREIEFNARGCGLV
jgi:hypothetical protein